MRDKGISNLSKTDLHEIAKQLSCPKGENGVKIGHSMDSSNERDDLKTIEALNLKENDTILEIGHGNGGHIENLFEYERNINYHGLELSKTMNSEAKKLTKSIDSSRLTLTLYDGIQIPYNQNFFNQIITVNTVYFWQKPEQFLTEFYRVLKKKALLY